MLDLCSIVFRSNFKLPLRWLLAKHKSVGKKRIEFKTWSNIYKLIDATKCIDAANIYELNLFDFLFHIP